MNQMTRSVLIINTPHTCGECELLYHCFKGNDIVEYNKRPSSCPLRPLPNFRNPIPKDISDEWDWGYNDGFNNALHFILGE